MDDLYHRLFRGIPCYASAQDRDLRIIAINDLFEKDFGNGIGRYCYQVYKGRSDPCAICPVAQTFSDGKIHTSEEIIRRANGDRLSVIVYTAPIRNGSGEIIAAVEASTDITAVKQLQQQYQTLFEEVPCYISVQDRNLNILEANRRFQWDFGEGRGQPCYRIYKHRTEPCEVCSVAQTFSDGKVHTSEEVVTTLSGRQTNVLVHTAPLRNQAGDITSVMEMSTNITELRQLQDRLTSLGLLVGSISHGIKGLLSGLDGGVYLMDTGFKKDNMRRVKQGWDIVQRNVDRIRGMVMNVLYYAKDREVFWQPIDLEQVTTSMREVVQSRFDQHGVALTLKVTGGTFEGDQNAIHSMLVNLVENSLDACRIDKKKDSHKVDVSAALDGDDVVFDISDNGIGMDQETREKAFSLFFSSKGTEGTGLGLFIAHKIVHSHGGTISIASSPGMGTCFHVRLPRLRAVENAQQADVSESNPSG